jgi:16S rRNA (cytosine1402-N4)-methyltransferase
VPRSYERGRINPATRIFQALRIYVNDELGELEKTLNRLGEIIVPGGRVAIISFHSLEDRLVKNSFKKAERDGILKIITKKPIVPDDREIAQNPGAVQQSCALQNLSRFAALNNFAFSDSTPKSI